MTEPEIPYYWKSLDWNAFMKAYPPPPFYEKTVGRFDEEQVRALQEERFRARVSEAWKVPFYSERWKKAGLAEGENPGLSGLSKFPTFTSDDLKEAIDGAPPFGTHHPIKRSEFGQFPIKIQTSGGTTGMPRITLFDTMAWEVQGIQYARAMWAQGGRPGDVVQIPVTTSLGNMSWASYVGAFHWLGAVPMTTGSGNVTVSTRQIELAKLMGTNGWVGMADYLGRLVEAASEAHIDLRQDIPTRWIHTYLGTDTKGVFRKQLQDAWGAPVYDNYGTHEIGLVAFECQVQNRMHINEDTVVLEVIDVEDGHALGHGESGNLVATCLHRGMPPIIRYNLRDRLQLFPRQACPCGLNTTMLSPFLGRTDQMVKLRGTNVYPTACQDAVRNDPRTTGEYICVVQRFGEGLSATTEMTVRVERRETEIDAEPLRHDLEVVLKKDLGVRVGVEIVEAGSLLSLTKVGAEGKPKRLLTI